ncbi:ABC transporter ATP-binding protein [Paenibacillus sp. J31TS4]|uniref:ABC transporter ATP-binding protein n=1 Tax=Paenibacillus sp. J31TS4 TaxID=2807195 RepID=UPI001B24CC56|nr:ABC transporter ATP-binding protein [Paenibacillus sp. J31TS4]GIP41252.1 ABC transporter ATP-binding protein [Paenibacillus sp. J31TS4]
MTKIVLAAREVRKHYGGVRAVDGFSCELQEGRLIGLIGPNGAGKSTLFNLLSGAVKPTSGSIELAGEPVAGMRPDQFSRRGAARTFQNIRLFKRLTILENVLAGFHQSSDLSLLRGVLGLSSYQRGSADVLERAGALLEAFGLYAKRNELAVHLSYGDQRRLEIARAMASQPRLLFLDEPAAGMNAYEGQQLVELIRRLWEENTQLTVFLIEHDMDVVMKLSQEIFVLDSGRLIFHGTPEEVRGSDVVREAYLGGDLDA